MANVRNAIAEYEPGTDRFTLWTTSQFPHVVRFLMGALVLNIPQHKLRVVAPDVGGGFGVKQFHYGEEAVITGDMMHHPIQLAAPEIHGNFDSLHLVDRCGDPGDPVLGLRRAGCLIRRGGTVRGRDDLDVRSARLPARAMVRP